MSSRVGGRGAVHEKGVKGKRYLFVIVIRVATLPSGGRRGEEEEKKKKKTLARAFFSPPLTDRSDLRPPPMHCKLRSVYLARATSSAALGVLSVRAGGGGGGPAAARSMLRLRAAAAAVGGQAGWFGQWQQIKYGRRAAASRAPVRIPRPSDDVPPIFASVLLVVLYVVSLGRFRANLSVHYSIIHVLSNLFFNFFFFFRFS